MILRNDHLGGLSCGKAILELGHISFICLHGLPHAVVYLFSRALLSRLDPVPTFDHIRLKADRTRAAVKLQEETTRIAKDRT